MTKKEVKVAECLGSKMAISIRGRARAMIKAGTNKRRQLKGVGCILCMDVNSKARVDEGRRDTCDYCRLPGTSKTYVRCRRIKLGGGRISMDETLLCSIGDGIVKAELLTPIAIQYLKNLITLCNFAIKIAK